MSTREFVALGTASQVPTRHRNHNGYLLLWDGVGVLFDPGEGTQRQMIRAGVTASQISRICITHFHGDHCLGLAGIVQRISLDAVPHEVPIHYPASGQVYFERLRHASIFMDQARTVAMPIHEPGPIAQFGGLTLHALPLSHTVPCWGYRLVEDDGVTLLPDQLAAHGVAGADVGRLLREGALERAGRTVRLADVSVRRRGQVVAFIMDSRRCDNAVRLAEGADLVVCESTYLSEQQSEAEARGHMTAADAATIAQHAGARRLVLTHFSQRYPRLQPFLDEASAIHDDVVAVTDGQRVPLPGRA